MADAFWLPPDGNPVGPMALEVTLKPQRLKNPQITLVTVTQRASEGGERWKRYYEVIAPGWDRALRSLKRYWKAGYSLCHDRDRDQCYCQNRCTNPIEIDYRTLDVDVVRVGALQAGVGADEHHHRSSRHQSSAPDLLPHQRSGGIDCPCRFP